MHVSLTHRMTGWIGLLGMMVVAGCGDEFVPPPPPELAQTQETPVAPVRMVEVCLVDAISPDRGVLEQELRQQAGLMRIALQIQNVPREDPGAQAEWVRKAKERGASLLLVEPVEGSTIGPLLSKTRDEGIPVVLLRRSIEVEGKPLPVVTHLPFTPVAQELVEAAVKDCRMGRVSLEGGALIVSSELLTDSYTESRAAAMKKALKEANVPRIETITYKETEEDAQNAIIDHLKAYPNTSIVVSEDQGLTGAYLAREDDKPHRRYAMIGSVGISKHINLIARGQYSAYADRNIKKLGRQALQVVRDLMDGKSVPDRTEIPYVFQRTNPDWIREEPRPEPAKRAEKLLELTKPALEGFESGKSAPPPTDSAKAEAKSSSK